MSKGLPGVLGLTAINGFVMIWDVNG